MSLIGTEITELRELLKQITAGTIDTKAAVLRLKVYKATADRERMILDIHKLTTLKNLTMRNFEASGLFSADEYLPGIGMLEAEKIDCPDFGVISRGECLDKSGDSSNFENCKSCKNFKRIRKQLYAEGE